MSDMSMESFAARLEAVERKIARLEAKGPTKPKNAWRRRVGMFDADPEVMRDIIAEGRAIREAERAAAREEGAE
jgi:hypothetical protein